MKLQILLKTISIVRIKGPQDAAVHGLAIDSRKVRPGFIFVAVSGEKQDGNSYIEDALNRGAIGIITDRDIYSLPSHIVGILVKSVRDVLPRIVARYYDFPSEKLILVGITGTNGKTTTSYLVKNILEQAGYRSAVLGTIAYDLGERVLPSPLTTPDIISINEYLVEAIKCGCKACVMEVSSHALAQGRVDSMNFDIAIFTTLGEDHLDYHLTLNEYLDTKLSLFRKLHTNAWAVVNLDNPYCRKMFDFTFAKIIGFSLKRTENQSACGIPLLRAKQIYVDKNGLQFSIANQNNEVISIQTPLIGRHNIYNILAAVAVGLILKINPHFIQKGLAQTAIIPGRLERVCWDGPFDVYIDYAHTPDALENVLYSLRELSPKRIILVFGCGGDRDTIKRPHMGRIASQYADSVIVTSDNPRTEDPENIIAAINKGMINKNAIVIQDRKKAINEAIKSALPGDIVLIAGKGHERYQVIGNTVVPFNDMQEVKEALLYVPCYH